MPTSTCRLLAYGKEEDLVSAWESGTTRVRLSHESFRDFMQMEPQTLVYGYNTLAGHRDETMLDENQATRFQDALIDNHLLGCAPFLDYLAARAVTFAKVQQFSNGGAMVSPQLYSLLVQAATDRTFFPQIPVDSSYSCGDVIPGAHWARGLLDHLAARGTPHRLRPGEGMALINGSFVHAGMALAAVPRLHALLAMMADSMKSDLSVGQADPRMVSYWTSLGVDHADDLSVLHRIVEGLDAASGMHGQWPVSFRAVRESYTICANAVRRFELEIDRALGGPSSNPLLMASAHPEGIFHKPYPQASFLLPELAVATQSMSESLKFFAWSHVGRMKWLLSGKVEGIPLDGQAGPEDIAFIQWPKVSQALLETLRYRLAAAPFGSGGDTSYGVEDIWTMGTAMVNLLDEGITLTERMIAIGMSLKTQLSERFGRASGLPLELHRTLLATTDFSQARSVMLGHYARPDRLASVSALA